MGEAADGEEAVALAASLAPDVLLLDLRMPRVDGLAAMQRLRAAGRPVAIVVLTTFHEDDLMAGALRAGARGYLLKDATREQLLDAVRVAARGGALIPPDVLARV